MFSKSSLLGLALVVTPAVQQQDGGLPGWLWFLIILAVVLIVLALILVIPRGNRPSDTTTRTTMTTPSEVPVTGARTFEVEEDVTAPTADKLEIIEGIGPKIAAMLNEDGIYTFSQLANADVDHLRELLHNAGLRLADPGSWPEQARLAAAGDMEALRVLQDGLKGGRV